MLRGVVFSRGGVGRLLFSECVVDNRSRVGSGGEIGRLVSTK
jgi:hypothetical protein